MTYNKGLCRYSPELDRQILDFLRVAYPSRDPDLLMPRWKWMFLDSADRCNIDPYVWLYHDGFRVAAHQGAIAVRYWDGEKETNTGWFVETMALPDVQGTPIGPSVIMKAKQDLPFNLSLGQTKEMRELQFRLGWEQVVPLAVSLKPLDWAALIRGKIPGLARPLVGLVLNTFDQIRGYFRTPKDVTVETTTEYTDEHNQFWNSIKYSFESCVARDASYLNWKYVRQPGQKFVRLEFRKSGQLIGLAVLKCLPADESYEYRRVQVIEFLTCPDDPKLITDLLLAMTQEAIKLGGDAIVFMRIAEWLDKPLVKNGFRAREATRYLLVSRKNVDSRIQETVMDADSWLVTQGDSDIDRPE